MPFLKCIFTDLLTNLNVRFFFFFQTWQLKTAHLPSETNFDWKKLSHFATIPKKEQNYIYAKFLINLQLCTLSIGHVIDGILQKLALRTNQSIDKLRKCHDISEIMLKLALNTIQPTNQSIHLKKEHYFMVDFVYLYNYLWLYSEVYGYGISLIGVHT